MILNFKDFNLVLEKKETYKIGDKVLIEYWYNGMITPVIIKDIVGRKFVVGHNITESQIFNAPDERISKSDIIDYYQQTQDLTSAS